jgi:Carboxypeptidase regulatory-like domain
MGRRERLLKSRASKGSVPRRSYQFLAHIVFTFAILLAVLPLATAQDELPRGSIQGTVIDPSGAPVAGAALNIFSKQTETSAAAVTDAQGKYDSGPLPKGTYGIEIEARNFRISRFSVIVQDGKTTNGDRKLVRIDPGAPELKGQIDPAELNEFPIDGRELLGLTQFEPGILVQDGRSLDATKTGNFATSIDKISGSSTQYRLDGADIRDETKGDVTQNVARSSAQELTVSRSALDVDIGPTSSGVVDIKTRSGTDNLHGEAFGLFRDHRILFAKMPGRQDLPYQREDFGGRVGGALIKDKAFFFIGAEGVNLDARRAVAMPSPFQARTGSFSAPFRNNSGSGRLDYKLSDTTRAFYRFAYNFNRSVDDFGDDYSIYQNHSTSPSHTVGLDLARGDYAHSFRFNFLQYHNSLQDTTAGFNPLGVSLPVNLRFSDLGGGRVQFGQSPFAPQTTYQRNVEGRWDATREFGDHTFHFGGSVNWISTGGYASPYALAPQVTTALGAGIDPNPLDYPVLGATISNGQRFSSEKSGFGFSHGMLADIRLQGYVADAFRYRENLTITLGVHYMRDTGQLNSDLSRIPCTAANPGLPSGFVPCTGNAALLDQFSPQAGQGLPIRQPNYNFAPQVGFAWDPFRNGRTIVRGGAGVFYDTSLMSNARLDRPTRLRSGLYGATDVLSCAPGSAAGTTAVYFPTANGLPTAVRSIDGLDLASQVCGQPVGTVAGAIADLQTAYAAAVTAAGAASNPNFVGNSLSLSLPVNGLAAIAPGRSNGSYQSPRSFQMNFGIQREVWGGGTFTANYVRNISEHYGLIVDTNHVGDANYLYKNVSGVPTAALNAITNTITQRAPQCLPGVPISAGAISQLAISCYISSVTNPSINDFAANGLDSGVAFLGGLPANIAVPVSPGADPRDFGAAFPGVNALVGQGSFQTSSGQSLYNAGQFSLKQKYTQDFFIFRGGDILLAYTLSKFVSNGGDNPAGANVAYDYRNPGLYKGPSPLDRRHQLTAAWTMQTRWGGVLSFTGRYASPAPLLPSMLVNSGNPQTTPGEIFRTDFTGDGTPGDRFPFKRVGPFDALSSSDLSTAINTYNSTQAGSLTPAGTALVTAGLFSQTQLATLKGVTPYIVLPPLRQFNNEIFKSLDAAISWPFRFSDRLTVEPTARFFNVFNFASFLPLSGQLTYYFPGSGAPATGGAGSANGTPPGNSRDVLRIGQGSGVYNFGAPRQMEFGVKVTF